MSYAHHRSRPAGVIFLPARRPRGLLDVLFLWSERARQRRLLAGLDERMLKDVGLSRTDVSHETGKPFWRD